MARWLCVPAILALPLLLSGAGGVLSPAAASVWRPTGPFGGSAERVVTSPSRPDVLLAGSPNALLYRSADGGASWAHLPFPAELASSLHVILPHPADDSRILVGISPDSGGSGLRLTTNSGNTWDSVAAFERKVVWALAHFPADANVMVAGASDGVYQSQDTGATWRRISPSNHSDLAAVVSIAIHPTRREIIYAGTPHLPWKTIDGGRTWQPIHTGMLDDSDVFSIDIDRRTPTRVLASACSGIYRSVTAGATWTKLRGSADASFRTYVMAHDPHVPGRVWAGTTHGLMRSTDDGATWQTLGRYSVKSMAFDTHRPGIIYLATRDAGLLKSTDGATFHSANRGYSNRSFFALAATGAGALWLSGETAGIVESVNRGASWKAAAARETVLMLSACPGKGAVYAGGRGFLRQFHQGRWTALTPPGRQSVRSLTCAGPRLIAVSGRAAFESSDSGRTWSAFPSPKRAIEWNQIASAGGAVLLAATSHGLLRSPDRGRTWSPAPGDLGRATVASVLVHPERRGLVYAAQHDRIFFSSDGGLQWTALPSSGLERAAVRALAIAKGKPTRLYALAAGRGVFFTDLE